MNQKYHITIQKYQSIYNEKKEFPAKEMSFHIRNILLLPKKDIFSKKFLFSPREMKLFHERPAFCVIAIEKIDYLCMISWNFWKKTPHKCKTIDFCEKMTDIQL